MSTMVVAFCGRAASATTHARRANSGFSRICVSDWRADEDRLRTKSAASRKAHPAFAETANELEMSRMPSAKATAQVRPRIDDITSRLIRIRTRPIKNKTAGGSGPSTGTTRDEVQGSFRKGPPPVTRRSIGRLLRILRKAAPAWSAPVLTLMAAERRDPFLTLIGCILSLRTKDQATAIAAPRLFERADTPWTMLELSRPQIEGLIYPVGFYRTKARVILQICRDLLDRFDGKVPDRIDDLLTLNGVGRKTANLVVTEAFGKPGICVDTHVHRISNRWGLIKTMTPEKSETALRKILPRRYWIEYNSILVAFGQTICQPVSPWCSRCPVNHLCLRVDVTRSR
jgi:endonuclease III